MSDPLAALDRLTESSRRVAEARTRERLSFIGVLATASSALRAGAPVEQVADTLDLFAHELRWITEGSGVPDE